MKTHATEAKRTQEVELAARWTLGAPLKAQHEEQDIMYLQVPCPLLQGETILLPLVLHSITPLPPTRR